MTFQCEDLRDFGLVLVPPSSPEYEPLFADIQRRVDHPLEKRETSAILLNDSGKSIAAIDAVWRYEDIAGRTFNGARLTTGDLLLLPFSAPTAALKVMVYRLAILPGSRRYLGEDGMAGDNKDVRGPEPDEVWKGGYISGATHQISDADFRRRILPGSEVDNGHREDGARRQGSRYRGHGDSA